MNNVPLHLNMAFWSLLISCAALLVSQWKFFSTFWRRTKLTVELHNLLFLTHKYGNPNLQLHVIVSNIGGRKVRVKGIKIDLQPSTREKFGVNASTYQKQGNGGQLLLTPFSLGVGEEWSHLVFFWNALPRHVEKRIKEGKIALRKQINERLELRTEEEVKADKTVFADPEVVAPLHQTFKELFRWHPDEYEATISFETEPPNAVAEQKFRFVVFESDAAEMQAVTKNYAAGAGVFFADSTDEGVVIPIQKVTS